MSPSPVLLQLPLHPWPSFSPRMGHTVLPGRTPPAADSEIDLPGQQGRPGGLLVGPAQARLLRGGSLQGLPT